MAGKVVVEMKLSDVFTIILRTRNSDGRRCAEPGIRRCAALAMMMGLAIILAQPLTPRPVTSR